MLRPILYLLTIPLLLAPLPGQSRELQEDVNHALDTARPALMAHLRAVANERARTGELALVVLAAVHDDVDAGDDRLIAAIDELAARETEQTYDLALRLMVLEVLPTFPNRNKLAKRDGKALLKNLCDGAFGYDSRSKSWDLSNTQYGALGLRSAKALGLKVPRRAWQRLADAVGDQQDSYGGFGYSKRQHNRDSYASMTAAGIAVLAVCRQALGEEKREQSELTKRINRGWLWFQRNIETIGSKEERWSYYFHYGLERAAILCDVEQVGEESWYERGARMLIDEQLPSGGWRSQTDNFKPVHRAPRFGRRIETAFAILFLRRKFQKVAGPITPSIVTLPAIGPFSKQKDIEACAAELRRRGKAALPDVLKALRSEIENQRRAAGLALQAITGQTFGFDPALEQEPNRAAIKAAELWYLRNR